MSRSKNIALVFVAPLLALCSSGIASCASTDAGDAREEDASSVVDPVDAGAPEADAADAAPPCDPGEPECVSKLLSCEEADFCPVPSGVDRRYTLRAVWGSGAGDVWAVGSGGTILRYDGTSWKPVPSGTTDTLLAVWGSGSNDIWVAGSTRTILHGPGTWTPASLFGSGETYPGRVHTIWGSGPADVRLGGEQFGNFDEDLGSTWGNHARRVGDAWGVFQGLDDKYMYATVRAIWGSSADDVWMSIDDGIDQPWARGTLVHGKAPAAGQPLEWSPTDSQSSGVLESIWGSSAADVWAVGASGAVRRWATGATKWTIVDVPTKQSLHGVWGSGPNDVWVVGDAGVILHFDGTAWAEATVAFPLGKKPSLTGVWGSGPNDVWVVGDGYTLHFNGRKAGK